MQNRASRSGSPRARAAAGSAIAATAPPIRNAVRRSEPTAARTAGLRIEVFRAENEDEFEPAFAALSARRKGAVLVANDPLFTTSRDRIVALAARHAVPAIYTTREFAEAGGLISYGASLPDVYRLAGNYAGRILKGANPADAHNKPAYANGVR